LPAEVRGRGAPAAIKAGCGPSFMAKRDRRAAQVRPSKSLSFMWRASIPVSPRPSTREKVTPAAQFKKPLLTSTLVSQPERDKLRLSG